MTDKVSINISKMGNYEIGGCDTIELIEKYGSPLYVMDENIIRQNCRTYKQAIDKYYDGKGLVLYASKALCCKAICKIAEQEGLGLDVVSGGELYTAIQAGVSMDKIYFHGNNKTIDEIRFAIDNEIRMFVVDNKEELYNVNSIAKEKDRIVNISFRIKPGVEAHTHDFVQTGQIDSKFGVALENGEAIDIVRQAAKLENVKIIGIHCHIGSQIFDLEPFETAARIMLEFISQVKDEIGVEIDELNLGGGYGIKYTDKDDPVEYDSYIKAVSKVVKSVCDEKRIKMPFIIMEPGRSIVAPAGITLYTVGSIKEIKDIRTYVSVDGGIADNPRYALYEADYDMLVANRPLGERTEIVTIAGKCCETGDLIAKDIAMPKMEKGDVIAVLATGGYNYSMSSNYNRIPRPPIILVKDGKSRVIVKREDYNDIVRNDILPEDI